MYPFGGNSGDQSVKTGNDIDDLHVEGLVGCLCHVNLHVCVYCIIYFGCIIRIWV